MTVLFSVRSDPVAILEIESKIFNGLALQLLDDAWIDCRGRARLDADGGRQRLRISGVILERGERTGTEARCRIGAKQVRATIDHADGLTTMSGGLHAR